MLQKSLIKRILNLSYIRCNQPQHEGQQMSSMCLNEQCQLNRLACCNCQYAFHSKHTVIPVKDYIIQVYKSKSELSPQPNNRRQLPNVDQSHIGSQKYLNYLWYLDQIQNKKLSTLKTLLQTKQHFIDQINQIQVEIQINTRKYVEKIMVMIKEYFGTIDLVEQVEKITYQKNSQKIQRLLQRFMDCYDYKKWQKDHKDYIQNDLRSQKQLVKLRFDKVINSFSTKMTGLETSLSKFDFTFIPKLLKSVEYENIKFFKSSEIYSWNPLLKGNHLQIDQENQKIIRVKYASNNTERFALMKIGFSSSAKAKKIWAVRINKLTGWIGVGIALKKVITLAGFKFNYTVPLHGSYLISMNGYSWSHSEPINNSKNQTFAYTTGDIIIMQYDPVYRVLSFKKIKTNQNSTNNTFTLSIAPIPQDQQLCPCVNMCSVNDQVEIIALPQNCL